MWALESTVAPDSSGRGDRIVQSSLDEELVDGCVADSALLVVVMEVSFYAAWPPIPRPSQLKYEVYCLLWGSMDRVRSVGLDVETCPPMFPVDAPGSVEFKGRLVVFFVVYIVAIGWIDLCFRKRTCLVHWTSILEK